MKTKLTPRQNEIISEALAKIAVTMAEKEEQPDALKSFRRALVSELKAVTRQSGSSPFLPDVPSISG